MNSRLDPFDPANGYNPNGSSNYTDAFKNRYFKAQAERMNRLIDDALELLQQIEAGQNIYSDDAPFNIPRFDGARLLSLDSSIRHTTSFRKSYSRMTAASSYSSWKVSPRLARSSKRQTKHLVMVHAKA